MFEPEELGRAVAFLVTTRRRSSGAWSSPSGRVASHCRCPSVALTWPRIELSQPMIDVLRTKPGSERITVTRGDMATTRVEGTFGLVYLVFNTITNLLTQDAQVASFENAAAHLEPGGCFVVETFVPALQRIPLGERLVPFDLSDHHIGIDEYDIADQMLVSHHISTRHGVTTRSSGRFRYAWPAELDSDGTDCRIAPPGTMGRLAAITVHGHEHQPRLCVGEAQLTEDPRGPPSSATRAGSVDLHLAELGPVVWLRPTWLTMTWRASTRYGGSAVDRRA